MIENIKFYSRDFSQRIISEFKGEKELSLVIDYLASYSPKLKILLIEKANELIEKKDIEKLKRINNLIKEINSYPKEESKKRSNSI